MSLSCTSVLLLISKCQHAKMLKILNLIPVSVVIVLLELACSSSLAEPLAWPSVLFNLNEKIPKQTDFLFYLLFTLLLQSGLCCCCFFVAPCFLTVTVNKQQTNLSCCDACSQPTNPVMT